MKKWFTITGNEKFTTREIMGWLWNAWRGNRLQAVLNALVGLVSVVVSLAQVWAVKHAIDVASGTAQGNIYLAVALMGALILCDFALNICGIWISNLLGIKAQNRMQQRMLDRILRSQWGGKERMHSGDVLNRLEMDVNNVVRFLTETIPARSPHWPCFSVPSSTSSPWTNCWRVSSSASFLCSCW